MAEYLIQGETLTAIADAIRTKKGIASSGTSDYMQLDYIESTGTQYIDTGYKFTSDKTKIVMVLENLNTAGNVALCGTENGSYSGSTSDNNGWFGTILFAYATDGAEKFTLNICSSNIASTVTITKNIRHTVEIETFGDGTGRVILDGTETNISYVGHMEKLYNYYLFAINNTGSPTAYSKMRLCSFQIYDNDVLVRDFLPARYTDGTVGLYDAVSQELYTNTGSGTFTAGEDMGAIGGTASGDGDPIPTTSMAAEILAIESGGVELPTLTNPASASDIARGMEAIGVDGEKLTGAVLTVSPEQSIEYPNATLYEDKANNKIGISGKAVTPTLLRQSATVQLAVSTDSFGDATAADVAAGKTFTSESGVKVEGTLSKPLFLLGTEADTITESTMYYPEGIIQLSTKPFSSKYIVDDSVSVTTYAAKSEFGNATARDVATGKTFTSADGLKVTGAMPSQAAQTIIPGTSDKTIASGKYLTGTQTIKGDSNLVSSNIKSGVSIFGVSGTYEGGADTSFEDKLLDGTLTEYTNSRASKIYNGTFAFNKCLSYVTFTACKSIGISAFCGCNTLTNASFPKATYVGAQAFDGCIRLESIYAPSVSQIRLSTFQSCSKLTSVNFPVCTLIEGSAFNTCSSLSSAAFGSVSSIGSYAFIRCSNLSSLSFPTATLIGSAAFSGCRKLTSLKLGASTVCTLNASNAFTSTPIGGYSTYAGQYGSIYVPSSLLTSYKSATNWAYFSNRMVGY